MISFDKKNINSDILLWILKRVSTHDTLQHNPLWFQSFVLRFWSRAYVIDQSNVAAQTSGSPSCRPSHSLYICSVEWERVWEKNRLSGGHSAERCDVWLLCPTSGTFERHRRHRFTRRILKRIFLFPSCLHGFLAFSMRQWNGNVTRFSYVRVFSSLMWLTLSESIFPARIFAVLRAYSKLWNSFYFLSTFCNNQASFSTLCTGFQVRSRFLGCATSVLW